MGMRFLICVCIAASALVGCATSGKNMSRLDVQRLQVQLTNLETELKEKDAEIKQLRVQLEERSTEKKVYSRQNSGSSSANKATPKNIQKALKNAGLYTGPVDGKIGKETKKAIRAFQESNGLIADGIVGKQTWTELAKYLN